MIINFNHIKTFYNALIQRMKGFRGNWEQNDDTADDYIKNRTHWSEGIKEKVIIDWAIDFNSGEITSPMDTSGPIIYQAFIEDTSLTGFIVGQKYTVIWDNKTYECIAKDFNGIGIIGNESFIGYMNNSALEDTGEPFFIGIEEGYGGIVSSTEADNHTCIIKTLTEVVHKLDKKFIDMPDGIVTEDNLRTILEDNLAPVSFTNQYNSLSGRPTIYTDIVRYGATQGLTDTQKATARSNVGAANASDVTNLTNGAVRHDIVQSLTDIQKEQAKDNIGVADTISLQQTELINNGRFSSVHYGNEIFMIKSYDSVQTSSNGIIWKGSNMLPGHGSIGTIAFGNGMFVAVDGSLSCSIQVFYSTDGITWIKSTTLTSSVISRTVFFAHNKFFILSANSMWYSEDGQSWTVGNFGVNPGSWNGVCYGNNLFIAYASVQAVYSEDGINWSQLKEVPVPNCEAIIYANGRFVALGEIDSTTQVAYSEDGIVWTERTSPFSERMKELCYGCNKFIAYAYDLDKIAYSQDGVNWTEISTPGMMKSIVYGKDKFVAIIDEKCFLSYDGILWNDYGVLKSDGDVLPTVANLINSYLPDPCTLTINDIPYNGSEKVDITIPRSDWNELNEVSLAYVKNRTHYIDYETLSSETVEISANATTEIVINNIRWFLNQNPFQCSIKVSTGFVAAARIGTVNQSTWLATLNNNTCIYTGILIPTNEDNVYNLKITVNNTGSLDSVIITCNSVVYVPLDENYIPNTIARTADIPVVVQPDLSQNDPNAADYVKNREVLVPDWEQNDESALDFVKNRTHYVEDTILCDSDVTNAFVIGYRGADKKLYIHEGAFIEVYMSDGTMHIMDYETLTTYKGSNSSYTINGIQCEMNWRIDSRTKNYVFTLIPSSSSGVTITRKVYKVPTLKQLDEKFIPDTIARVADTVVTPSTAAVGQTIVVKSVDENGKPAEWETVDFPTTLPNPNTLSINGTSYDGSEAVSVVTPQADWSQNDPNAADYVKNRTHWVEEGEAVLLDITINDYESNLDSPIPLVEGKSYTVEYNGTTYECVASKDVFGEVCIGNLDPMSNEYPFSITTGYCSTNDDPASIRVTFFGEKAKTLDAKFLPVASQTEYGVVTLNKFLDYALPRITLEVGVTKEDNYNEKAVSACWINNYVNWRNYFAPFGGTYTAYENGTAISNTNRIPALSEDGKVTNLILTWGEDGVLKSVEERDA